VLNGAVFVALMLAYEGLRRALPAVYSSQMRRDKTAATKTTGASSSADGDGNGGSAGTATTGASSKRDSHGDGEYRNPERVGESLHASVQSASNPPPLAPLLAAGRPLEWVLPVYGASWSQVRRWAGLDGYFFLRYIRMNVRITAVSTAWFFALLVPVYASGGRLATGWYHYSIQNLAPGDPKLWIPCAFLYLFSAFCCFCAKQEYRHYLELRQDFLARGSSHVHPQHHYSLVIECVPAELRSDKALLEYFAKLFPGRVHSASVVLNLPDLEEASQRCLRTCRRLEKSIAHWHATGRRPSHIVGRGRVQCLGVDLPPIDCGAALQAGKGGGGGGGPPSSRRSLLCPSGGPPPPPPLVVDGVDHRYAERPPRGTRVDSISYYTHELAADSRALFKLQQRKLRIAESGSAAAAADSWFEQASRNFSVLADRILEDSHVDNDLLTPHHEAWDEMRRRRARGGAGPPPASSFQGGLFHDEADFADAPYVLCGDDGDANRSDAGAVGGAGYGSFDSSVPPKARRNAPGRGAAALDAIAAAAASSASSSGGVRAGRGDFGAVPGGAGDDDEPDFRAPFSGDAYKSCFRRALGRLGLDFLVAGIKAIRSQLDVALEGVISATMSSTGFVTFLDLSSATCAASARLSARAGVLMAGVAPEPREIRWQNAYVSRRTQVRRENMVNALLFVGVVLWSFPLLAIQTFANVKTLVRAAPFFLVGDEAPPLGSSCFPSRAHLSYRFRPSI
jgi:hypothetical protein